MIGQEDKVWRVHVFTSTSQRGRVEGRSQTGCQRNEKGTGGIAQAYGGQAKVVGERSPSFQDAADYLFRKAYLHICGRSRRVRARTTGQAP